MKKTAFSLFISIFFIASLGSCQRTGCTVMLTNTQTGEQRVFPDNDCNGVADIQEGTGGTTSGVIIFTGKGIIRSLSGTSRIGYSNDGNGNAATYLGTTTVSTQDRLLSFEIPGVGIKQALTNQDLVTEGQLIAGELAFTNLVVDAFDRQNVTEMQAYMNNDQKIMVVEYEGELESTPVWSALGAEKCNQSTGQLMAPAVHYRIINIHLEYVKNVFRIQY